MFPHYQVLNEDYFLTSKVNWVVVHMTVRISHHAFVHHLAPEYIQYI